MNAPPWAMSSRTVVAVLAMLAAASAGAAPLDASPAKPAAVQPSAGSQPALNAGLQGHRIDEWKALSSESLVIRTNDGKRYRATLTGKCIGLKFTDTIAFVTRGERSVDRFAGIMLPDGSRCYFKTFEAISPPADSREARRP